MKTKLAGMGGAPSQTFVDDVFSTYLYTGNSSTQTITNGIDLAGKGGLVWLKPRSGGGGHGLFDSNRGTHNYIASESTNAQSAVSGPTFTSTGFILNGSWNFSTYTYAAWTFRKAAKFFDAVTYTGTGSARTIAHSLGVAPGMVIVKRIDTSGNWQVYSNGLTSAANSIQLDLTAAQASAPTVWNSTAPTSSVFSVGTDATVNASGGTYVAYLFAHDTSSTGIIQCGSFTTDGSGNATVNLGWEPQYLMIKGANVASGWQILDTMRGYSVASADAWIDANTSAAENNSYNWGYPTATGFYVNGTSTLSPSSTYIYMAIRRPNKPPTSGTQVYNAIARTGTSAAATITGVGFAPDLYMDSKRNTATTNLFVDRLRGAGMYISSETTATESGPLGVTSLDQDGVTITGANGWNGSANTYINWFFKRASGFLDVVCYTGTGTNATINHSLGVLPELAIIKNRSVSSNWNVAVINPSTYSVGASSGTPFALNLTNSMGSLTYTTSDYFTSSYFKAQFGWATSENANNYVCYLFATKAGISKVGSYTGNGSSQTIDCGFTTGARFVLIKRTDSTGDWYVWDTARGIIAGNDPHLSLNTTAAEVTTDDSIDPYSAGFAINQVAATNINVSSATYIFLAVA